MITRFLTQFTQIALCNGGLGILHSDSEFLRIAGYCAIIRVYYMHMYSPD